MLSFKAGAPTSRRALCRGCGLPIKGSSAISPPSRLFYVLDVSLAWHIVVCFTRFGTASHFLILSISQKWRGGALERSGGVTEGPWAMMAPPSSAFAFAFDKLRATANATSPNLRFREDQDLLNRMFPTKIARYRQPANGCRGM